MMPKLCTGEARRSIFREWGKVCPGCARRRVDEVGRERVGRRRRQGWMEWEGNRAGRWEGEDWQGRDREVERTRERKRWDGGGLRGRGGWGNGY